MHINRLNSKVLVGAALAATAFASQAASVVGITSQNQVVVIDTANIGAATPVNITGLDTGDRFVGIDLRPSTNTIYGVTRSNKVYTLDQSTGAATFVSALSAPIVDPLLGYGIDFNPVADFNGAASLRFVSSAGGNFAINVNTGVVGNAANTIGSGYSAVAYTNSDPTGTAAPASTGLYYIDTFANTLAFAPTAFNTPTITTVGALGVDVLLANGFEVFANGTAFGAFNVNGDTSLVSSLYDINLATGAASYLGEFNGTLSALTGSAIAPIPEPETYALMLAGLGLVGFMAKRRRQAV